MSHSNSRHIDDLLVAVKDLTEAHLGSAATGLTQDIGGLMPGKMLRSRLAARLYEAGSARIDFDELQAVCAATELTHTASLCHDDVVDNALMRRSMPTLWQSAGPTGAILLGDLLLCEATDLMIAIRQGQFLPAFIAKVREVVAAEAEHEFLWRGKQTDEATALRLARGKTGALFAFVAQCCGGDDPALSAALCEAGYRVGTAYQLADDLLDVIGDDATAGKTLGTDRLRDKATLPLNDEHGAHVTTQQITQLCISAGGLLVSFPQAKAGLRAFVLNDLQPVVNRHLACSMELMV